MANRTVKNLIYLKTDDNECSINFNCYNGKSYITIFHNDSNVPLSIWLSDTIKSLINKYLNNLIRDNKPSQNNTIVVSNFDDTTKTWNKSAVISISTNDKGLIYFGFNIINSSNRKVNDAIQNKNLICTFQLPKAIEITSNTELSDIEKNRLAAKTVYDILVTKLPIAEIKTLETDMEIMKQNAAMNNGGSNQPPSNGGGNDILF